jgi:hypothetical protein
MNAWCSKQKCLKDIPDRDLPYVLFKRNGQTPGDVHGVDVICLDCMTEEEKNRQCEILLNIFHANSYSVERNYTDYGVH